MLPWGHKQLHIELEDKKHQFSDDPRILKRGKKPKICKSTKTKVHNFTLKESKEYRWSFRGDKGTRIDEYRCPCGKKKVDFVEI